MDLCSHRQCLSLLSSTPSLPLPISHFSPPLQQFSSMSSSQVEAAKADEWQLDGTCCGALLATRSRAETERGGGDQMKADEIGQSELGLIMKRRVVLEDDMHIMKELLFQLQPSLKKKVLISDFLTDTAGSGDAS
ncbi:hypothetical protein Dimus_038509 [Dionaea muscipula]